MTHSVLLCTSFRAHRINHCCAHHPRSSVCGGVIWVSKKYGCAPTMGRCWAMKGWGGSSRVGRRDQGMTEKAQSGFYSYFLLREVTSWIFPCWPPEWESRDKILPVKLLRFKSCLFVFVLGSGDGEMRYAALFLALNFNLGWLFQPYLNHVVHL